MSLAVLPALLVGLLVFAAITAYAARRIVRVHDEVLELCALVAMWGAGALGGYALLCAAVYVGWIR